MAGIIIAKFTEYCTAYEFSPTRDICAASEFGPAPVIIKGMGVGLLSVSVPALCTVITILACNQLAGQYAVAIAAVGLLSTLGITLATDAYGPVADNAGGIAEMAQMPPEVRSRTDKLDALGNTTAATGKGLAIASASLTAVGLIAAFVEQSGLVRAASGLAISGDDAGKVADLSDSLVLSGVLLGAALPMVFAALTMLSVDRGARAIITEVRLQFATAPQLMRGQLTQIVDGHTYPDSTRCVRIATEAAIQEMVLPGVLAVFIPVAAGFILGPKGTCGLLGGALGGCFMLAVTMATAGGAWDNAKKWATRCAEEGEPIKWAEGKESLPATREGLTFTNYGIKKASYFSALYEEHGVEALVRDPKLIPTYNTPEGLVRLQGELAELYHKRHSATVVGDTLGDPFKDTSGPSLNVLIKTMTMMALMLAPAYKSFGEFQVRGMHSEAVRFAPRRPPPHVRALALVLTSTRRASARRAPSSAPSRSLSSRCCATLSSPTSRSSTRRSTTWRSRPRRRPTLRLHAAVCPTTTLAAIAITWALRCCGSVRARLPTALRTVSAWVASENCKKRAFKTANAGPQTPPSYRKSALAPLNGKPLCAARHSATPGSESKRATRAASFG